MTNVLYRRVHLVITFLFLFLSQKVCSQIACSETGLTGTWREIGAFHELSLDSALKYPEDSTTYKARTWSFDQGSHLVTVNSPITGSSKRHVQKIEYFFDAPDCRIILWSKNKPKKEPKEESILKILYQGESRMILKDRNPKGAIHSIILIKSR